MENLPKKIIEHQNDLVLVQARLLHFVFELTDLVDSSLKGQAYTQVEVNRHLEYISKTCLNLKLILQNSNDLTYTQCQSLEEEHLKTIFSVFGEVKKLGQRLVDPNPMIEIIEVGV